MIALVWAGLKFERPGPAVSMRLTRQGNVEAYQFVLGSGWVSRFVRRADLEAIPMMWHLVNGDNVLRFKDFAGIVRPRRLTAPSKKGRKRIPGQGEMLLPIPGKKGKEAAAGKPVARPSTRQKKAG